GIDVNEALRAHMKVLEIRERLIRRNPRDVTLRSDRAWGRLDIALCLGRLNRRPEAISWIERAREEFESAHRERPDDPDITMRLVDCLTTLADALRLRTTPDAMLDASQRACTLIGELARAHPENPLYQEQLARNLRGHSERQIRAKVPARASL